MCISWAWFSMVLTSFISKRNKKSFQGSKVSAFSFLVFSNASPENPSQNKIRIPWKGLVFSCTLKKPVHNRLNKAIDNFNLQLAIEKLLIEKTRKYPQQDPHYLTNYLLSKYIKIMQILAGLSVAQHLPASWQHSYKGEVCLIPLVIL